jgi:arylsulfatase A-like enzyme
MGRTHDQVTMTMDWLPTLLAAAGTSPDPAYRPDGLNLLPILTENSRRVELQSFLALQSQRSASGPHRRLQVPQDPRQHFPIQTSSGIPWSAPT